MSATNQVNQILASQSPDWNSASLRDVQYCIQSKINRYRELRRYRNQDAGHLETQAISDDLIKLFRIVAQKRGQRGIADLKGAIDELEEKVADRVNPFDMPQLDALKSEYDRLTQQNA